MPRTHGYSKKGQRCYGTQDWGAKGRTNAIGALIGSTLLTVSLFESTINSKVFTAWVKQDLIGTVPNFVEIPKDALNSTLKFNHKMG